MSADARIEELKLELPPAPKPAGVYSLCVQTGSLLYASGHGPLNSDGSMMTGKVGLEVEEAHGKAAARQTGLAMLATLKSQLGSLDKIARIVKVLGMVNAAPEFQNHPQVINGFSELMVEVFGEAGRAARSAVGMGSLPSNISVEIEAIFEMHPDA
ncbi:RidA family protein [Thalassoroseus pseudoceratinae]|uniref:RidA family protein n=1 Tax=Thalassoroseus pseudoceratinae TaxID=2713176 RepID=UPI00142028F8|nr:RidA family protein [Thalassoroseus pseudoceratinae]